MTKIEIEKIIKRIQNDSDKRMEKLMKRHTGALLEEFQSRVSVIAEQYSDIQKTLNSHTITLDSHTKMLNSHTRTLDSHTDQIAGILVNLNEIKLDIKDIKSGLDKKVNEEHFVNLDTRVQVLEKQ